MAKSATIAIDRNTEGVSHETDNLATQNVLKRLRNIEGQVRGLQRMVEEDQYCIDILTQISATRSALNSAGMKVLHRHVDTCVAAAVKGIGQSTDVMIEELMTILSRQEL